MRKLIESTFVSLDGIIEAPERWASFDAEATAMSIKQLDLRLTDERRLENGSVILTYAPG